MSWRELVTTQGLPAKPKPPSTRKNPSLTEINIPRSTSGLTPGELTPRRQEARLAAFRHHPDAWILFLRKKTKKNKHIIASLLLLVRHLLLLAWHLLLLAYYTEVVLHVFFKDFPHRPLGLLLVLNAGIGQRHQNPQSGWFSWTLLKNC